MSNWTEGKLTKLTIEQKQELTPQSTITLLERLNKTDADEKFAKRLISYYYKLDNNETGSKVVNTSAPAHKVEGLLLSKSPRKLGEKHYEAENLYILILKTVDYPETQDKEENICAAGKLYKGQVIEAQQWTKKDATETMFEESHVGSTFTFEGQFGSYLGKVQFSIWDYDDSGSESYEFVSAAENWDMSQFRKNATNLLDADDEKYQPQLLAVTITTVTIGSIWQDGGFVEQEFPYFQLNAKSKDNENINLALTYSPSWPGLRGVYGMDTPPKEFEDIFIEAMDEDYPHVYAQSMLEDMEVLVGFTLNTVKPFNDNYTIYGNLFSINNFVNVEMVQPELETFFDQEKMETVDILSDGFVADTWVKMLEVFNTQKKPFTVELLIKEAELDSMQATNAQELCDHFTEKGVLTHINNKYGFTDHFDADKTEKRGKLIAAFVKDARKNTAVQISKRAGIDKAPGKVLLNEMLMDGMITQPQSGRYATIEDGADAIPVEPKTAKPTPVKAAPKKDNELGKQITSVVKSFGGNFETAQLVEMVKGAYEVETGNKVSVNDNTLKQLIEAEKN